MISATFMRWLILPLFPVGLAIAACGAQPERLAPDSPMASELKLLERQTASLRTAIVDAKRGGLFEAGDLAVSVSEEALQRAVSQALPIEQPVSPEFRARIDRAVGSFRSMQGSVRLEGRVWALSDPETWADLVLLGGIRDVEVDASSGRLSAEIALDGWDVKRAAAAGAEMDWIKDLVRLLGERGLVALRDLVPAIRIPVGIEKGIDLPGVAGPPPDHPGRPPAHRGQGLPRASTLGPIVGHDPRDLVGLDARGRARGGHRAEGQRPGRGPGPRSARGCGTRGPAG